MPEMLFQIRWPDGENETCYSPSLVIKDHFAVGETYPFQDFLIRSRTALMTASERVREKYGRPCSLALGQLARIEASANRFTATPANGVTVVAFKE